MCRAWHSILHPPSSIFLALLLLLTALWTGFGQPVITQQPQNQTNFAGTTATFSVVATGTPPLAYQWRSGVTLATATNLPGETNATLVLNNVQRTWRYAVVVSDTTGSVTSVLARLQVLPPAIFQFAAGAYSVDEWACSISLTVQRVNDTNRAVSVDYATTDGTAKAGQDYQAVSGTLTFQENETLKNLSIPILRANSGKTFQVTLSHPANGATLGASNTTVTIGGPYATVTPRFDSALAIRRQWGVNVLTWSGGGTLQRADQLTGPWQTLTNAKSPLTVESQAPTGFYRVTSPRPVNVYIPSSYDGEANLPLVILLHGYGATGGSQESYMQYQPLAEARGFLYCHPDGPLDRMGTRYWNGTDCNDFWSDHVDDAGYLRALIQEIERRFTVDTKRVYLIGHSTGGSMAYTVACQSADLVAGIATLAGNTYLDPSACQPSEPVNILCIGGTADQYSSYYGGTWRGYANTLPRPGVGHSAQIWAGYNDLAGLLVWSVPLAARAQFNYTTNEGTITITGYTGSGGAVTIPETIEGLPVTSIGYPAFYGCTSLTSVTIGNSVTYMEGMPGPFSWLTSLTSVFFRGNAPSLGSSVFSGDNNTTVYYLPGATGWGTTFADRPTMLWNPQIQTTDATFGVGPNGFGFTITGTTNIPIVVEASTALISGIYVPLQSCTLTNGSVYFTDPDWQNYARRFYRIRSP